MTDATLSYLLWCCSAATGLLLIGRVMRTIALQMPKRRSGLSAGLAARLTARTILPALAIGALFTLGPPLVWAVDHEALSSFPSLAFYSVLGVLRLLLLPIVLLAAYSYAALRWLPGRAAAPTPARS